MSLEMTWEVKRVNPKFEFKIARSAETYYDLVIVKVSDGKFTGYGEAQPNKRYEPGADHIVELLENLHADLAALSIDDAEVRQAALEGLLPQ